MLIEVVAITSGSAGGVASGESPQDMIAFDSFILRVGVTNVEFWFILVLY